MNREFVEQEIVQSGLFPKNLIRRFFLNKAPIFLIFLYAMFMKNYISLIYLLFGLILFDLEFEKYYDTKSPTHKFSEDSSKKPLLEEYIKLYNYRPFVYHLVLIYSLLVYVFKFIMTCIAAFDADLFNSIIPQAILMNYELFITPDLEPTDIMLTFLPNLAMIVVLLAVILFKSYTAVIRIEDIKKFKGKTKLRYFYKPAIGIILLSFPMTNLSILTLIYSISIIISVIFWSLKYQSKGFFYPYCKILQVLCVITIILQYIATISTFKNTLDNENGPLSFKFLGIDELSDCYYSFKSFIYIVSVFCIYFLTISFCDSKKSHQLVNQYKGLIQAYEQELNINQSKRELLLRKTVYKNFGTEENMELKPKTDNKSDNDNDSDSDSSEDLDDQNDKNQQEFADPDNINILTNEYKPPDIEISKTNDVNNKSESKIIENSNLKENQTQEKTIEAKDLKKTKKKNKNNNNSIIYRLKKKFIQSLKEIVKFFSSHSFIFRLTQVASVFVITRYISIFSLYLIIWLFLTGLTLQTNIIYYGALFIGLPSSILIFFSQYFANVSSNGVFDSFPTWIISKTSTSYWLEYLITFGFLFLFNIHLRILLKRKRAEEGQPQQSHKKTLIKEYTIGSNEILQRTANKSAGLLEVILAFLLKNSYILCLITIYLLGLTTVNLLNFLLMVFFIGFLINPNYARRYWLYLLLYINFIIFMKYLWFLNMWSDPSSSFIQNAITLTGVNDDTVPVNSLFYWTMFLFAIIQYEAYKSSIVQKYSVNFTDAIANLQIIKTYFLNFSTIVFWIQVIYWKSLIWITYFIMILTLSLECFNIFNAIIMCMTVIIYYRHLKLLRTEKLLAYAKTKKIWTILTWIAAFFTGIKYLYKFARFNFLTEDIYNWLSQNSLYNLISNNASLIGLRYFANENLRIEMLGDTIILFFAVLGSRNLDIYYKYFENIGIAKHKEGIDVYGNPDINNNQKNQDTLTEKMIELDRVREIYETYLSASFLQKSGSYKVIGSLSKFTAIIFLNMMFLFIAFMASYYRLSFTMLLYQMIFIIFYHKVHGKFIELIRDNHIIEKMMKRIHEFRLWFIFKKSQNLVFSERIAYNDKSRSIGIDYRRIEIKYRKILWNYIIGWTVVFFLISYLTQIINASIFNCTSDEINCVIQQIKDNIMWFSFIIGVSGYNIMSQTDDTTSIFLELNYPYFILLVVCFFELKFIDYLDQNVKLCEDDKINKKHIDLPEANTNFEKELWDQNTEEFQTENIENLKAEPTSESLINKVPFEIELPTSPQLKTSDNYLDDEQKNSENENKKKELLEERSLRKAQLGIDQNNIKQYMFFHKKIKDINPDLSEERQEDQAVLLKSINTESKFKLINYYNNSYVYMMIRVRLGFLTCLEYLFIFMQLISADCLNDIFSIIFLTFAYYTWAKGSIVNSMKFLNLFISIVILLQYCLLLLNINAINSPMLPNFNNPNQQNYIFDRPTSIISLIVSSFNANTENPSWVLFLGFGGKVVALILGNMSFLVLQSIIWAFLELADVVFNKLSYGKNEIKNGIFMTEDGRRKLLSNYVLWKDRSYAYTKRCMEFLFIHAQTVLMIVLTCLSIVHHTYMNFYLTCSYLLYVILIEFVMKKARVLSRMKFMYSYLQAISISILIFLAVSNLASLHITRNLTFVEYFGMQNVLALDKVIMFYLLQLFVSSVTSEDYQYFTENYHKKIELKARLVALCTTYRYNDIKIVKILENYMVKKEINSRLQQLSIQLKIWHDMFLDDKNKSKNVDNENIQESDHAEGAHASKQKEEPKMEKSLREKLKENHDKMQKASIVKKKTSMYQTLKINIINKLKKHNDPYMFSPLLYLYEEIVRKNRNVIGAVHLDLVDYVFNNFHELSTSVDKMQKFYLTLSHIIQKTTQPNLDEIYESVAESFFGKNRPNTSINQLSGDLIMEQGIKYFDDNIHFTIELPKNEFNPEFKASDDLGDKKRALEPADYTFDMVAFLLMQVILTNWVNVCYINLLIYHVISNAYLSLLFPIFIFAYALPEETRPNYTFWKLIFYFLTVVIVGKMYIYTFGCLSENSGNQDCSLMISIFGDYGSFYFETWLLLMLLIQLIVIKKSGFIDETSEIGIENINQTFIRKKLNNDFNVLIEEFQRDESSNINEFSLEKQKKKGLQYQEILQEVEKDFMFNLNKFEFKNQNLFTFRLFSIHNKKVGKDIYPWITLIQLIISIYIVLYFSCMESASPGFFLTNIQFSETNLFSGTMVLVLFTQIGIVLIDRKIILINHRENSDNQDNNAKKAYSRQGFRTFLHQEEDIKATFKKNVVRSLPTGTKDLDSDDEENKGNDNFFFNVMKSSVKLVLRQANLDEEKFWRYSVFSKYILHITLLITIHAFIYIYLGKYNLQTDPYSNSAIVVFYGLYCIYFTLSAYQIKEGIPEFKGKNVLMQQYTTWSSIGFQIFRALPFLFEIKTFFDWTCTETALDLFQWLKFEEIYAVLYIAKCNWDLRWGSRYLGDKIAFVKKFFLGCCGIIALLTLIFGPMLLFSTFNPLASSNPVTSASVTLGLQINSNYYQMFTNSHADIEEFPESEFSNVQHILKLAGLNDISISNLQSVAFLPYSDTNWDITQPSINQMSQSITSMSTRVANNNSIGDDSISLLMEYSFTQSQNAKQNMAPSQGSVTLELLNSSDITQSLQLMQNLINIINCANNQTLIYVNQFYTQLVHLITPGNPINIIAANGNYINSIYFTLKCIGTDRYWMVQLANSPNPQNPEGLTFYPISYKVSSFLLGYSVTAFYFGVVYLIGRAVRGGISGGEQNLTITDLPKAHNIIQICEGILVARADKNLQKEEILYWELIDLLRSPEVLKIITESCVQEVKEKVRKKVD